MDTAVATTQFTLVDTTYTLKVFSSAADQVLVVQLGNRSTLNDGYLSLIWSGRRHADQF